jgi:hypothetical protein
MKKIYNAPEIIEIVSLNICDVITSSTPVVFRKNDSTVVGNMDDAAGFIDRTDF